MKRFATTSNQLLHKRRYGYGYRLEWSVPNKHLKKDGHCNNLAFW